MFTARRKLLGGVAVGMLILASAAVWLGRTPLLAWYYTRELARAEEGERERWVARVLSLDTDPVPGLLDCLRRTDARACGNAQAALARLAQRWGSDAGRRADLANRLAEDFPELSPPGQQAALEVQTVLVQPAPAGPPPAATLPPTARLLFQAARMPLKEVRARGLALAAAVLGQVKHAEVRAAGRELVRTCLRDEDAGNRIQAVRLTLHPELDLLEQVVPLLSDPEAPVRRSAMVVVGPAEEAIRTDYLLRWLHDPDADMRKLCEKALRSRGLRQEHLKLGRLITDDRPGTRLQVLEILPLAPDLEPGIWLRHLSHDPEPAVRAAAVRAAAEQRLVDLTDRISQIADNDPSATVRQLARYYLASRKPNPQSTLSR
jgi:hypothetical protein